MTHRTTRRPPDARARITRTGLAAAAASALLATHCPAAERSWANTAGGVFSTSANWQNGFAAGVNDVANFHNSTGLVQQSYTITFGGNAQTQALRVKNDFVTFELGGRTYTTTLLSGNEIGTVGSFLAGRSARLTIQNGTFAVPGNSPVTLGAAPSSFGSLNIAGGGILTGTPRILVGGASASGSLTVNGGTVSANLIDVASGASSVGNAVITGPFATLTTGSLLVGNAGSGTMSMLVGAVVQNNTTATLGNASGASGLVNLDGATVRWTQAGVLTIGNSGAGSVNVVNGGSLNGAAAAVLGNNAGGFGRLNVAGVNSRARFTDLAVGNAGVGSLTVTGGGSLTCTGNVDVASSGAAFVAVSDGGLWTSNGNATIAAGTNTTAQIDVSGTGSRWTNSGSMSIGALGTAALNVTGGADVSSHGTCVIAANGDASVRVEGAGSSFVVQTFSLGNTGVGTIDVLNGAFLQTHAARLGAGATGNAVVTVSGQGSNWTLTDNGTPRLLDIGGGGSVSLNILDGGDVIAGESLIRQGAIVVDGVSSRWINSEGLTLGFNGASSLQISAGGRVESTSAGIRNATATVSGANSALAVGGPLTVSSSTSSVLDVLAGGRVQNVDAFVASGAGAVGTVNVHGGTWNNTGSVFVGGNTLAPGGVGVVNLVAGAFVSIDQSLVIWNNGTVNLGGGQLNLASIDFRGSTFNFSAGTLRFTGVVNFDASFLDKLLGNPRTLGPNRTLIVDTTPTLGSLFILGGGTLTVPQLAVGSPLQFDSGTFNLTAANLTIGNAGLFGNTVVLDARNINVTNSTNIQPGGRLFMLGGHFSSGGGITNNGEIIVNSPFTANLLNPIVNNAEIRVSTGATANFFGNVTGAGSFTGAGAKVFKPGSNSSVGAIDSGGSTVVEAGATLAAARVREQSLTVNGDARIFPGGAGESTSRVSALAVTGRLDLSDNALVVDYGAASPVSAVGALLSGGFAGGSWNGAGINSSIAASTTNRALGFAEATDLFTAFPASFAGESIDSTAVVVRFTLPGDANLDRSVNIGDFSLLAAHFNTPSRWSRGDFNFDGTTGLGDFALLAANFNQSLPATVARPAAVPEPTCASALAVWAWLCRRRAGGQTGPSCRRRSR